MGGPPLSAALPPPAPEPEQTEARGPGAATPADGSPSNPLQPQEPPATGGAVGTGREDQDRGAARSRGRVHPRRGGRGLRGPPGGRSASPGSGQWPGSPGAARDPGLPFLQPRRGGALQVGAGPSPGPPATPRPSGRSRKGGPGLSVALRRGRLCQAVLLARRLYSGVRTGGLPSGRGACGRAGGRGQSGAAGPGRAGPGGSRWEGRLCGSVSPPGPPCNPAAQGQGRPRAAVGVWGEGERRPQRRAQGGAGAGDQSAPTSIRGPVTPLDRAVSIAWAWQLGAQCSELRAAGSWGSWRSALSACVELGRRTASVTRENKAVTLASDAAPTPLGGGHNRPADVLFPEGRRPAWAGRTSTSLTGQGDPPGEEGGP